MEDLSVLVTCLYLDDVELLVYGAEALHKLIYEFFDIHLLNFLFSCVHNKKLIKKVYWLC